MVTNVQNLLNLTSSDSTTRIGANINKAYRRVISSCGLETVQTVVGVQANTTIGNRSMTWSLATTTPSVGVEKIFTIYNPNFNPAFTLTEVLLDDMRNMLVHTDPAEFYAVQNIGSNFVTIFLDVIPATVYALQADVRSNVSVLSGSLTPNFPEDFHDILEHYAMAREYKKIEQDANFKEEMAEHESRLSQLRQYLAESAYLDIFQGKTSGTATILDQPLV